MCVLAQTKKWTQPIQQKIHISYLAFLLPIYLYSKFQTKMFTQRFLDIGNKTEDIIYSAGIKKSKKKYWYLHDIIEPALYIHISLYVTSWDVEFPSRHYLRHLKEGLCCFKKDLFEALSYQTDLKKSAQMCPWINVLILLE